MGMVRVKAIVEYEGSEYSGWQVQPNAPTVQSDLERALKVATRRETRVAAAGRTDAGVHAAGQVAVFDVAADIDLHRLRASLNGITGPAVTVVSLETVPAWFDPRRDAVARSYRYTVVHGRPRSPLLDTRSWHVPSRLDAAALQELAAMVVGRHDFSAFRAADCEAKTTHRSVRYSAWTSSAGVLVYDITAQAFLKNMVRILVGTMVETVLGKRSIEDFAQLLEGGDRRRAGRTAPAKGLLLVGVEY